MIKIFGCGIAGLVCGIELLKNGVGHEIIGMPNLYRKYYEAQGVCYKEKDIFAGSGITPREYGIEPFSRCKNAVISLEGKEVKFGADMEIFVRGFHRKSLDKQLLEKYEKLGGFLQKSRFSSNDVSGDVVIAADGFNSQVCKKFNVNTNKRIGAGAISIANGKFDPNTAYVFFNKRISKYWYSYLLPLKENQACVAVCLLDFSRMRERLEHFKKILQDRFSVESFSETKIVLNGIGDKPVPYLKSSGKEIFFVGDAASTVEPLAGFGISNAIASGFYCAKSIVEKSPKIYIKKFREIRKANYRQLQTRKTFERFGLNLITKKFIPWILG